MFSIMLSYFRTHKLILEEKASLPLLEKILAEAEYFGVSDLVLQLTEMIEDRQVPETYYYDTTFQDDIHEWLGKDWEIVSQCPVQVDLCTTTKKRAHVREQQEMWHPPLCSSCGMNLDEDPAIRRPSEHYQSGTETMFIMKKKVIPPPRKRSSDNNADEPNKKRRLEE
jgi:hypothetical protein